MKKKKVIKEFSDKDFCEDVVYEKSQGNSKKDLIDTVDSIVGDTENDLKLSDSIEVTSLSKTDLKKYVEEQEIEASSEENKNKVEKSSIEGNEASSKKDEESETDFKDEQEEKEESKIDSSESEEENPLDVMRQADAPKKESCKVKRTFGNIRQSMHRMIFGDRYVEFTQLLILDIIFFVSLIMLGGVLLFASLSENDAKVVSYQESSNLDYSIYLLPNEFYEDDFLGKDMIYVASLIDYINIDFDYQFTSNSKIDMDFSYKIVADLEITNKEGSRSFSKKQYVLLDEQNLNMKKNNGQKIMEKVKIDYSYYNSLANKFKAAYGLDTDSKLVVYMVVTKKSPENSGYTMNEAKTMNVSIQLSQKAVEIQVPYSDINDSNILLQSGQSIIHNYFAFVLSLFFLGMSCYSLVLIIKKVLLIGPKHNAYDVYVNKLLREYDRLITESVTLPSFDGKNIIKVRKFTELLDAHDNLQLPIIHYTITRHHKCYFYISHKDTIYLYILKAVDLEADRNEKKNK